MEHPTRLRDAILVATAAGDVAATATRRIATGNIDPESFGTGPGGTIEQWSRRWGGPAVTQGQIDRACEHLDDFVTTLADINDRVAAEERIDVSHGWRARLETSRRAAADVHNEVTATLATLGRYRTNIVLGRPLLAGDRGAPGGNAAGE